MFAVWGRWFAYRIPATTRIRENLVNWLFYDVFHFVIINVSTLHSILWSSCYGAQVTQVPLKIKEKNCRRYYVFPLLSWNPSVVLKKWCWWYCNWWKIKNIIQSVLRPGKRIENRKGVIFVSWISHALKQTAIPSRWLKWNWMEQKKEEWYTWSAWVHYSLSLFFCMLQTLCFISLPLTTRHFHSMILLLLSWRWRLVFEK